MWPFVVVKHLFECREFTVFSPTRFMSGNNCNYSFLQYGCFINSYSFDLSLGIKHSDKYICLYSVFQKIPKTKERPHWDQAELSQVTGRFSFLILWKHKSDNIIFLSLHFSSWSFSTHVVPLKITAQVLGNKNLSLQLFKHLNKLEDETFLFIAAVNFICIIVDQSQ